MAYLRKDISVVHPAMLVLVVCEFLEVFVNDLPSIPPNLEVGLCLDLEPKTRSISIPLYHMAPTKLRELKL